MKRIAKIFLSLILIIIVLGILLYGYVYTKLDQIQVEETGGQTEGAEYPVAEGITNILLIGGDSRGNDISTRSDAVMLLTLDTIHDNIKLTSFARDAYVNIPGYGYEKLTHAHAYGEAPLLLETVRKNFGVSVSEYVAIDFQSFITVIDLIDGVPATLEDINLKEFNRVSLENYEKFYKEKAIPFERIDEYGTHVLNGYQTLAYVRMRKTDSTFARDERQREVVESVFKKAISLPVTRYPQLFEQVLPYVTTNISPARLIKLGLTGLKLGTDDIRQLEFPGSDYSSGATITGKGWVLQWDEEEGRQLLHDFLNQ